MTGLKNGWKSASRTQRWLLGLAAAGVLAAGAVGVARHMKAQIPVRLPDASVADAKTFEVLDCQARLLDDTPALAVMFSQPVDAGQTLDKLMQVSDRGPSDAAQKAASGKLAKGDADGKPVSGQWVIRDNPRMAYFPYAQPQRNYRVQVATGLKSTQGLALAAAKTCDIATEEMTASFFFASRGVVLPAGQNGGLPVVTVNVPEVDIQFLRVEPAQIPKFLARVFTGKAGSDDNEDEEYRYRDYNSNPQLQGLVGDWTLDSLKDMASPAYLGRFVADTAKNRRHVTHIPVESIKDLQEPGIYVAVMSQPGRFKSEYQVTYFYVSDIGLHVHRHVGQMDVFASSLKSGKALSDVLLEVLNEQGQVVARGQVNGDGHAVIANVPDSARAILARQGKALTVVALNEPGLDLSEFDIGGHLPRNTKLFAYSGRDLYRPGETFSAVVQARSPAGALLPLAPIHGQIKRPDGKTVQTVVVQPQDKTAGYYQTRVALPADAQTGQWQVEWRADPAAKQPDSILRFGVEEFLPERLKLDLQAPTGALLSTDALTVAVQGDYLFGSPASGNRLLASVAVERQRNPVAQQWPGFLFGDLKDQDRRSREDLPETELDEDGKGSLDVPVKVGDARSPMKVKASFSLLESGGRPVVRSIERTWWPAETLIGIRPAFEHDLAREQELAEFDVIRVNTEGALVPLSGPAKVRLIKEDRSYYWRYSDQRGWHSGYTEAEELIESRTLALGKERARLAVPVTYGRYRLEIDDPQTRQTLRYRFYAGWGAQEASEIGNRPDRVQLSWRKAPFKPGDDAELAMTPPHDGEALVVVEADKVLWQKRVSVSAKGSTLSIPIDKAWERNDIYVSVVAYRPGSQGDRVTPSRALGLIHLPLARSERKLTVNLSAPAKVLPEKRTVVKVAVPGLAAAGNAPASAIVTVSAVDVGILNITRFASPDPFDFFYGKHRYAPELLDMYGKLIEKMDGSRGQLKWGGDSGMRETRSLPKKVKLVDLFSGPVALNAKGEAEIPLDIPDFNGTLRLMAVVSAANQFGSANQEMVVAAPLVAELSTPRFITPGDTATLALDVTNLSGMAQDITVKLEGLDPVRIKDGERKLSLKNQQRSTLRFSAEATDAYGLGVLRLSVAGKTAEGGVLNIVRESALQVQPASPLEQSASRSRLDAKASTTLNASLVERFYPASANVSVTVSNQPPLNIRSLVKGLLDYPYGCLEQTTSAAYPHVLVDDATAKAFGLPQRSRADRAAFIEGAIGRIAAMQGAAGGFSLWGSGSTYELWLTPYVLGFLQDAKAEGFSVPDAMQKRAQDWMLAEFQKAPQSFPSLPEALKPDATGRYSSRDYELLRNSHQRLAEFAHLGYMLAREQKAPLSTLRTLHDQYRNRARSPLPLVHLALALKLMGDEARAKAALDDALQLPYGLQRSDYEEWLGDYGTAVRDLALAYALLARHKMNHPRRENLVFDLANRMGNRYWYSTQERLALLMAAKAAGGTPGTEWTVVAKVGESTRLLTSTSTGILSFSAADLRQGVSLSSSHGEPLFLETEAQGYVIKMPPPRSDVIALETRWYRPDGGAYHGEPLKVGEMLLVRVRAESKRRIEDGMVISRIPAGLEVENLNISQGPDTSQFTIEGVNIAAALQDPRIKHREYRDDRFVAAAKLEGKLDLYYLLRVVSPGKYVVPPAYAEDMYRPEVRGVGVTGLGGNPAALLTVLDPRGESTGAAK